MNAQSYSDNSSLVAPFLIFFGGLAFILIALFSAGRTPAAPAVAPTPVVFQAPAALAALDPAKVAAGDNVFHSVCFACHGFNGMGISGLGKPLVGSDFINKHSDQDLLTFVIQGRTVTDPLNTTGVAMPSRGGNPMLTDDDLLNVITYIRSLNGKQVAAAPAAAPTAILVPIEFKPLDVNAIQLVTAVNQATTSSTTFTNPGALDYQRACSGCHGASGEGQYLLSSPLSESDLLKNQNSLAILDMLTKPLPPAYPTTGFRHPFRGGYPELTEEQMLTIYAYLLTLPH